MTFSNPGSNSRTHSQHLHPKSWYNLLFGV